MFLADELRYALRSFRRRPAVPLIAVAVLAVGLGGSLTVFSALYSALLKPLPYRRPERLVVVHEELPGIGMTGMSVSVPIFEDLRTRRDLFEDVAAYHFNDFTLTGAGYAQHIDVVNASWSLFPLLGVEPQLGRTFGAAEDKPGAARVVVLSHKLWTTGFEADPRIVGRKIMLDGEPAEVIGVMPTRFRFPYPATQAWVPLALQSKPFTPDGWQGHWLRIIARRAGTGDAALQAVATNLIRQYPAVLKPEYRWSLSIAPLVDDSTSPVRRWLYLSFGAVLCLLLAACANVAGLLLLRAAGRRGELAIRAALGAPRRCILGQILLESAVLAFTGCAAGLLLAVWGVAAINRWSPVQDVAIGPAVYGFAVLLALVSNLCSGLLPALSAASASITDTLKAAGSPGVTSSGFWRHALTAGQVAAALTLLSTGAVLTRSFLRLLDTPAGFTAAGVFCASVQLPGRASGERQAASAFFGRLQSEIAALPGVERASAGVWLPFSSGNNYAQLRIAERPLLRPQPTALSNAVLPGYFETLRIPLHAGRLFGLADNAESELVAVIDQEFTRQFLPGADPIGMHLVTDGPESKSRRIVGVVGSVKTTELGGPVRPFVYLPFAQVPSSAMMMAVRTRAGMNPAGVSNDVRRALAKLRPDVALFETATMEQRVADSLKIRRFVAALLDGFAAAGILLAALGLYGVLAWSVDLRRRELAIRAAIGARPANILGTVAAGGLRAVLVGVGAGLLASFATARLFQGLLYGVRGFDPASLAVAVTLLFVVAAAASWLPLRRALKSDPVAVLRDE